MSNDEKSAQKASICARCTYFTGFFFTLFFWALPQFFSFFCNSCLTQFGWFVNVHIRTCLGNEDYRGCLEPMMENRLERAKCALHLRVFNKKIFLRFSFVYEISRNIDSDKLFTGKFLKLIESKGWNFAKYDNFDVQDDLIDAFVFFELCYEFSAEQHRNEICYCHKDVTEIYPHFFGKIYILRYFEQRW